MPAGVAARVRRLRRAGFTALHSGRDLAKVTDYPGGKEHPGKNRTTGAFGLAGHNDPVAVRHIRIKRL